MMKRILTLLSVVLGVLLLTTWPTVADDSTHIEVVTGFYDAINAGDAQTAKGYLSESVVFSNPISRTEGVEAVSAFVDEMIAAQLTFELNHLHEENGRVTYGYTVFEAGEPVEKGQDGLTIVADDQIVFDGTVGTQAIEVAMAFYNAFNAGDLETALTFIAEDAQFINPTGAYIGKEAIAESLAAQMAEGLGFKLSNFAYDDGRVDYDYVVQLDETDLDAGSDGLTIVMYGQIVFDGTETTLPAMYE